jgi:hypothetical protein
MPDHAAYVWTAARESGTDDVPDNYHVVRITLADADDGTRVTLEGLKKVAEA